MAKAYSYIRFSTPEQLKGDSLRRQTELSEKYAAAHGLELDTRITMKDLGVSAYDRSNITKGALGYFLRMVDDGRIEKGAYLLVESLDRLSRDKVMDALSVFMEILKAGITIVTLADEQVFSYEGTNNNPVSLIFSILVMSRANEESATKSRRIRAAWDNKRSTILEKRLTARCPYWLRPAEGKQGFEFIPDRVEVVKRIFQMSKDGLGTATIVKALNSERVPTFSDKTDGWQTSYIQKTLSNRAVYGELQLCTQRDGVITVVETVSEYYPAFMTKEEWLLAASIRGGRRTRGGVSKGKHLSNLFSGLLRCGYCGSSMNMGGYVKKKANGEKREGKYVACSNARRGLGCKFIQWNYDDLEHQVLWFCTSVDYSNVLQAGGIDSRKIEDAEKEILKISDDIQSQQEKLKQLIAALESGGGDLPLKSIVNRVAEIEEKLESFLHGKQVAEKELVRLRNDVAQHSNFFESLVALIKLLQTLEGSELLHLRVRLSELLRHDIESIDLYPGGHWLPESKALARLNELKTIGADAEILAAIAETHKKVNKEARTLHMHFRNGGSRVVAPMQNIVADINISGQQ